MVLQDPNLILQLLLLFLQQLPILLFWAILFWVIQQVFLLLLSFHLIHLLNFHQPPYFLLLLFSLQQAFLRRVSLQQVFPLPLVVLRQGFSWWIFWALSFFSLQG